MNKEILEHYYYEGMKFGYALARGSTYLRSLNSFEDLYVTKLQQHSDNSLFEINDDDILASVNSFENNNC